MIPMDPKSLGTVVYFFSDFSFGSVWNFIQDEYSYQRLQILSNLKHVVGQMIDMNEYELVNFSKSGGTGDQNKK